VKVVSVSAIPLEAPQPAPSYWGALTWGGPPGEVGRAYPVAVRRRYTYSEKISTVLVRIDTDDGVTGWGEAKAPVAPAVVAGIVDRLLAPIAIGTRLDEIAVTWERMYAAMRVRGHDSGFWLEALSGMDIALWDAWARLLGQPVWALLGGRFREAVPVYASGIPATGAGGLGEVRRQTEDLLARGYRAIKVAIGVDPQADIPSVAAVRETCGDACQILADAAGSYDFRQALSVGRRLQELDVAFFEMPIPPEHIDGYARLAAALDIPLALDSVATRYRALEFLRKDAVHVMQPDVCRAGGITETLRIASLADAFGAQATPHVSIGSAVHFAASLQVAAALPNLSVLEHWVGGNPLGSALAPDLDEPINGARQPPAAPGLGITVDEKAVERLRLEGWTRSAK
jgi:D-galactarolactone cycloisomerase